MRSILRGPNFLAFSLVISVAAFPSPLGAAAALARPFETIRIIPPPHVLLINTSTTRAVYGTGDRLSVGLEVENGGVDAVVDLYFGMLLPDGGTVVSFTDLSFQVALGSLADLSTLVPIARDLDLLTPFSFAQAEFFSVVWSGSEAAGTYAIFFFAAEVGALDDGALDPEEIVAADATFFSFSP